MPIAEFNNILESVWANKTYHYIASWYRQLNVTSEDFQLFRDLLEQIRNKHKYNPFDSYPRRYQL